MREEYYNSYDLSVRDRFLQIRKFLFSAVILLSVLSLGYFLFWLGAISDEIFYEYGKVVFEPLASFLNLGDTSTNIYLNTSLMLVGAIVPISIFQYFLDKTEETMINQYKTSEEKRRRKEILEEQKSYMARFDSIRTYSICLSIDYEGIKNPISKDVKTHINNAVYDKISQILQNIEHNSKVSKSDVLIFTSHNFYNYDNVYDVLLNTLSKIKSGIEQKYSCKFIPSITTDAFSSSLNDTSIRKQHFEIQSFNFKNRALSTATFSNKYKHLKHNKYAGIPIGEYAYFTDDKMGTYELNVVYKNLAKAIS